jgi:hypothetical protein
MVVGRARAREAAACALRSWAGAAALARLAAEVRRQGAARRGVRAWRREAEVARAHAAWRARAEVRGHLVRVRVRVTH